MCERVHIYINIHLFYLSTYAPGRQVQGGGKKYFKSQVRQERVGGAKTAWMQFCLSENGPEHELHQDHNYDRVDLHRALAPENKKTSRVTSLLFSSPRALSFARPAGLAHAAH